MPDSGQTASFLSCPPSFGNLEANIDEISIAIAMLALPIGAVLSLCGFQLRRVTFLLCGFLSGMGITFAIIRDQIDSKQLPFEGALGVGLAGGLVLGLLSLGIKVLGLFIVGMSTAFLLAATTIGFIAHFLTLEQRLQNASSNNTIVLFSSPFPNRWLPISGIVLSCLMGGLSCLIKPRYFLIVGSSLVGTAVSTLTFGYFLESNNPLRPIRFVAASIIGTRYMQNHYGRYQFEYVPFDNDNFLTLDNASTTAKSTPSTPEKEAPVPAFLCWSDFVLVACWLLAAAFSMAIQFACSFSRRRKRHHRSSSRAKKSKRNKTPSSRRHVKPSVVNGSQANPEETPARGHRVSSQNELPPYSEAIEATSSQEQSVVYRNAEAWRSRNLNETTQNVQSVSQTRLSRNGASMALNWISVAASSQGPTYKAVAVAPNSPAVAKKLNGLSSNAPSIPASGGVGHLLRMRRSLGDVLSRDFISNYATPRPLPDMNNTSSQC